MDWLLLVVVLFAIIAVGLVVLKKRAAPGNDQPWQKTSRVGNDAKKERAISSAGISVVRWQARALPDEAAIRQAFAAEQPNIAFDRDAAKSARRPST